MHKKTPGVVIKSRDYGDGHRIVIIFSKFMGKIHAVAKNSRKIKSKFSAYLETGSENDFIFTQKAEDKLPILSSCSNIKNHVLIRSDMRKYGAVSLLLEVLDYVSFEGHAEPEVYDLLIETLSDIEYHDPVSSAYLGIFKILKYTGYRLEFFNCTNCRSKALSASVFSLQDGGVVCSECRSKCHKDFLKISDKLLREIKMISPNRAFSGEIEIEIGIIIQKYIKYQFSKDLKSFAFIKLFREKAAKERSDLK